MDVENPENEAFDLKELDAPATKLDHERQEPAQQYPDAIQTELYDENRTVGDFQKRAQEVARHALESLFDDWVKELASTLVYDTKILTTMASLQNQAHQLEEEKNNVLSEVEKSLGILMKGPQTSKDAITV
ncbi:uncharacterized protein LOC135367466 isoform X1 [Ornithodoros turicata]|uniref:uncharacterized protein LOC135367466 isoform X1 n=1 Tax=Ornithodoros turicata TaxID=34597 RepID=UPI00313914E9